MMLVLRIYSNHKNKILSLLLRSCSLLGKFFLIIFLAKKFSITDVGQYGIFVATITFALYILGADLYTYTARKILSTKKDEWAFIIGNQLSFYMLAFFFLILPLFFIIKYIELDSKLFVWFFLLLLTETYSQEIYRLIIVLKLPIKAHIVSFIRLGAWIYCLLAFWILFDKNNYSIFQLYRFWFISNVISILLGFFWISKEIEGFKKFSFDLKWIYSSLLISKKLLLNTLLLRAIFTLDRYLILFFQGEAFLGVYTYYVGFSNTLMSLIETSIISQKYPDFVQKIQTNSSDTNVFKSNLNKEIFNYGALGSIAIVLVCFFTTKNLGKGMYFSNFLILPILLLSNIIQSFSLVPHFILYAYNDDLRILRISLYSILIFLISSFLLNTIFGKYTIPLSLIITYLFNYKAKTIASKQIHV